MIVLEAGDTLETFYPFLKDHTVQKNSAGRS
jgi:hypothetical protein